MWDTSEIQFYMLESNAFKKIVMAKQLTALEGMDGICYSLDGVNYLVAVEKRVEAIEFYVHEFTEFVLRAIIMQELDALNSLQLDIASQKTFGEKIAHYLSKETEGDKQW